MLISEVQYTGQLRTTCKHLKSGNEIITDAPTDNNGKGEAFSPTDLVATALVSCMMTIIGIKTAKLNLNLKMNASVEKIMGSNPRKIDKINIVLAITGESISDEQKELIKEAALNCPVAKSLDAEIEQNVFFKFID